MVRNDLHELNLAEPPSRRQFAKGNLLRGDARVDQKVRFDLTTAFGELARKQPLATQDPGSFRSIRTQQQSVEYIRRDQVGQTDRSEKI